MISAASKEGLSHLPCCLCLQQERKSLCGCFRWSWPRESSGNAQQDAAGSTGLAQPRGCARGGRKKRRQEGCPAGGQHCSSTPGKDPSLSRQCVGCMFVPKEALTAGHRQWDQDKAAAHPSHLPSKFLCFHLAIPSLALIFLFPFFLPCRNPAYPSELSRSSTAALDGRPPPQ